VVWAYDRHRCGTLAKLCRGAGSQVGQSPFCYSGGLQNPLRAWAKSYAGPAYRQASSFGKVNEGQPEWQRMSQREINTIYLHRDWRETDNRVDDYSN
jgi:hypothetical protein